ncbi:Hypothetical predicted protein [Marmota monax]|uniref:Peptidase S1 domain-containing protein n=1 Tax=Marmota monax TaxID=9995 RepID=A0A5E4BY51_MARMO|nr:Hypothetical predicted protein [Marmota monax]
MGLIVEAFLVMERQGLCGGHQGANPGTPAPMSRSSGHRPHSLSSPFLRGTQESQPPLLLWPSSLRALLPQDTGVGPHSLPAPSTPGTRSPGPKLQKVLPPCDSFLPRSLWARVGDDHLLLLQGEQLRLASHPVVHPKYLQGSGPLLPRRTDEHDLMLLKLGRPVVQGPRVQVLQLPNRCAQPGDQCQIAGWGTTSSRRGKSGGPEAGISGRRGGACISGLREEGWAWTLVKYNKGLSCSRVTLLTPKACEVFYPGVITSNMICAGLDQGQDPCQSDSGGPLVCDQTLQGILSWGVYPCGSAQHPAVYTQICKYVPWIKKTIRSK